MGSRLAVLPSLCINASLDLVSSMYIVRYTLYIYRDVKCVWTQSAETDIVTILHCESKPDRISLLATIELVTQVLFDPNFLHCTTSELYQPPSLIFRHLQRIQS